MRSDRPSGGAGLSRGSGLQTLIGKLCVAKYWGLFHRITFAWGIVSLE